MAEDATIEGWAIVAQFGHRKLAGYVSTNTFGNNSLLRIDVPASPYAPAFTSYLGISSIFDLTLVTEDIVHATLATLKPRPVTVYEPYQQLSPPRVEEWDQAQEDDGDAYDEEDQPYE
jgi:hypothetical protein